MKMFLLSSLVFVACGPAPDTGTCTVTYSGAKSGSSPCSDKSPAVLGAKTAETLNWLDNSESDDPFITLGFQLPQEITATTYTFTEAGPTSCSGSFRSGTANWNVRTITRTTLPPIGTCTLTLTSVVDKGSSLTKNYTVHGHADATMVGSDMSTITVKYEF